MNKPPKLFLPVSHNGNCDVKSGYAVSLATAFSGCHVLMEETGGSHADRQMNNVANRFLKTDCDVMLIIDCDTVFTGKDIQRALGHMERGLKAVWGLYPKKQDDAPPCLNTWPEVLPPDEHGLVNVRRAGRGFLMVKREVFEALKKENGGPAPRFHNHGEIQWAFFRSGPVWGQYSAIVDPWGTDLDGHSFREWISEDWMFCEDLRIHLGIPTLVDTGIACAHIGSKTYRFPEDRMIRTDSNITSWKDIHGWFDYEDLYRDLVAKIPDGGSFVEVGSWLGRSMGAFHAFAKEAGKTIHLTAVDTFQGEPANETHRAILETHGGNVEKAFRANMKALGLNGELTVIVKDSVTSADGVRWGSVDAGFIDASHLERDVINDIGAWLHKIKPGGILCGHDYDEPGVRSAVAKTLGADNVKTVGRCWVYQVPV